MNFDERLLPVSLMIKIVFTKYITPILNEQFIKFESKNDIESYKLTILGVINNSGIDMVLSSLSIF